MTEYAVSEVPNSLRSSSTIEPRPDCYDLLHQNSIATYGTKIHVPLGITLLENHMCRQEDNALSEKQADSESAVISAARSKICQEQIQPQWQLEAEACKQWFMVELHRIT